MSDQDIQHQHSQQDGEISSTKIDTGPFLYQQYKPKSFSSLQEDIKWVYPDNPFFKQTPKVEHRDTAETSTLLNPDSNPEPLSEQINNLQSTAIGKPDVKPKPLIGLINDLQSIVTGQQDSKINSLFKPFGLTNISDIKVLNASSAIATENLVSKPEPVNNFLSTSQSVSSKPVKLADRFTGSSNNPQSINNEQPIVISKPLSEFLSDSQPSLSNTFDLSKKPDIEQVNTPQPIDTVHPIEKKLDILESEQPAIESVNIPQPLNVSEKPINQPLEFPLPSVPQHLPFDTEPLRGLLDDLNSLGLLEKPITHIEFDEPLLVSNPSSWPSGINAVVQQAPNQVRI